MDLSEAIKKYENHLREDVIWSWQDADKFIYINAEDEDLQKWRIKMPEPPDWAKLVNFGLDAKHQVFVYEKYPPRLVTLVEDVEHRVYSKRTKFDTEPSLERAYYNTIWSELRRRNKDFEEEIAWIQSQWYFRLYGKWIMIHGKPVYIDGWHWFYLNYWPLEGTGELPEYRQRDMKWFHAQRYAYTTTETIDYKQETNSKGEIKNKVILLEDGTPKMKDVGFRTIFGTNNLKGRRVGETSKTCAINYCMGTEGFDRNCGLQGNSENTAKDIYDEKLLYAFNKMPFFFVPQMPTINTQTGLYFAGLKGKGGLNSKIGFATTSRKEFYDQKRLDFYHADECFGKDTEVLMYDGAVKKIQDIEVGDYVVGEDGNKKKVLKTNQGVDQLYKVDYKKGDGFVCNGNHVLKTSFCQHTSPIYKEISVKDFYNSSNDAKKHTAMYKSNGINYPTQEHIVDPYFIGLYVGDGILNIVEIANVDEEIITYCKELAKYHGLKCYQNRPIVHSFKGKQKLELFKNNKLVGTYEGYKDCEEKIGLSRSKTQRAVKFSNGILEDGRKVCFSKTENIIRYELQRLNLLYKKHIPREYLYDSFGNRLNLLAGLLDSDGYLDIRNGKPVRYEIVQVYEHIAKDIQFLAQSLGFYCSFRKKKTSMKRKDGTCYHGEAYRLFIYGDLFTIPCKVNRKISENVEFSNNRRDPLKFGFSVEQIEKGEYYGITVEDHSFLLKDFTVVHNCGKMKLESIIDRHGVVKRCCSEGAIIKGLMIYTSTAEDMDHDAGIRFEKLSDDSMFEERMVNGQTKSGLINVYFPMYEAYFGFIDRYGEPIIHNPREDQIDSMVILERNEKDEIMGAKEYLESIEKDFAQKGALRELAQHQRQHPKKFRECFALAIAGNNFNTTILKERITELKFKRDKKVLIGDYVWTGPKFESDVIFRENPEGKWYVSSQLSMGESNQSIKYDGFNKMPRFDSGFILSADAYRFDETDSYRESKGGITAYEMFNPTIDGEKNDPRDYKSERFVATYLDREETKELYAEEVLKAALYWNALVYPEINVTIVQDFFIRKGYRGYLHFDVDEFGYKKKNCGFNTAGPVIKQKMFTYVDTWINLHASKCDHRRLLEECLMIRGPKYTKDFDLFVSMAGCLLGAASKYTEYIRRFGDTEGVEVGGFWGVKSDSA